MTEKSDTIDGQNEITLNDYGTRSGGRIYCNITNWSRTVNRAKLVTPGREMLPIVPSSQSPISDQHCIQYST